jgi:hypothetical protein
MSIERSVEAFVGVMILASLALTYFVHANFVWMSVFVGANVIQQAFTGFCPAAMFLRKIGMRSEGDLAVARATRSSQISVG